MGNEFPNPIKYVRGAPMFLQSEIRDFVVKQITVTNNYFQKRAKDMSEDITIANNRIDSSVDNLNKNIDRLLDKEKEFIDKTKRISSGIRKNSESLATGIGRIKSAADFDELEKYTTILERLVNALNHLDSIESKGKLDNIIKALK